MHIVFIRLMYIEQRFLLHYVKQSSVNSHDEYGDFGIKRKQLDNSYRHSDYE